MKQQQKRAAKGPMLYVKFVLMLIASGAVGAACSMLVMGNTDGLAGLARQLSEGLSAAGIWLMAAGLLLAAAGTLLWAKAQKLIPKAMEDDEAYETADRTLCLSLALAGLGTPWLLFTSCLVFPGAFARWDGVVLLAGLALLILENAWFFINQAICIKSAKQLAPEKQGNVFDTHFHKDWYASCDEAERQRIGDCAYFTFRVMNAIYPVVMILLLVIGITYPVSALWALLLGGLWLVQTGLYQFRAYWLEHVKNKH